MGFCIAILPPTYGVCSDVCDFLFFFIEQVERRNPGGKEQRSEPERNEEYIEGQSAFVSLVLKVLQFVEILAVIGRRRILPKRLAFDCPGDDATGDSPQMLQGNALMALGF